MYLLFSFLCVSVRLFLCLDSATQINFVDLMLQPCSGLPIFVGSQLSDAIVTLVRAELQGISLIQRTFIGQKFYNHLRESAHLLVSFIANCTFKSANDRTTQRRGSMEEDIHNDKTMKSDSAAFYLAYYILHSKFPV